MGTPVGVAVSPSGAVYYGDASLDTVRVDRGGDDMSRFGRRTFLGSSAGVAAGVAAAGAVPAGRRRRRRGAARSGRWRRAACAAGPPGPLRAGGLTVNGAVDPVGVDPDDCSFAWTLQRVGRAARADGLPDRGAADRPGPRRRRLGQRSGAVGPTGLRRLRAGRRWRPTRRTSGPCRRAGYGDTVGTDVGSGALHDGAAAPATGRRSGCARPAAPRSPTV